MGEVGKGDLSIFSLGIYKEERKNIEMPSYPALPTTQQTHTHVVEHLFFEPNNVISIQYRQKRELKYTSPLLLVLILSLLLHMLLQIQRSSKPIHIPNTLH